MQDRKIFLATFAVAAFIMKIVAQFVHEVFGHGSFVLLAGGHVTSIYISVLWPYDLSQIDWILPSGVTSAQLTLIYAGDILACSSATFVAQTFSVLKKKMRWHFVIPLFWFAFWTYANSTGYLIMGGLSPFGDVYELIALEVFTKSLSLVLGLAFFGIGFVVLSWLLRRILAEVFSDKKASLGVTLFWLIIPALVTLMLANLERGLQVAYFPYRLFRLCFQTPWNIFWF